MMKPKWTALTFTLALLTLFLLSFAANQAATMGSDRALWQAASEIEPNDTPADANRIAVNASMVAQIPLAAPGDIDYFVLATEMGGEYELRMSSPVTSTFELNLAILDSSQNLIAEHAISAGVAATIPLTSADWTHYFRVAATALSEDLPYEILVIRTQAGTTEWDACEINDSLTGIWSNSAPPGGPCRISDGETIDSLNFVPYTDQPSPNPDYFVVSAKAGRNYFLETMVTSGVDTEVFVYPPGATSDDQYLASNDDAADLGLGSRVEWRAATDGDYIIKVVNLEPTPHMNAETYRLSLRSEATVEEGGWDKCEVNDLLEGKWLGVLGASSGGGPCPITVGQTVYDLNFVPYPTRSSPNSDFFEVELKPMRKYRVETTVTSGVDTVIFLYKPGQPAYSFSNDDAAGLGQGSRIEREVGSNEAGMWRIRVDNLAPLPHSSDETYELRVIGDACLCDDNEPNWSFHLATLISPGETYQDLNFVPCDCTSQDNDFFKMWVVARQTYQCETRSWPGPQGIPTPTPPTGNPPPPSFGDAPVKKTNTNIIFCSGPSWEQCFMGNTYTNPINPADPYRSQITYTPAYTGWLYSVIGPVGAEQILPGEWPDLRYSFTCNIITNTTPTTPAGMKGDVGDPASTAVAVAGNTPTLAPLAVAVLPLTTPTPAPPPAPAATPTPDLYTIQMASYYDRNGNAHMDAGEGINDVLARSYDTITGELVSVHYTDETGAIIFNVPANGPVRVSVPFFGLEQIVTEPSVSIQIRVAPSP